MKVFKNRNGTYISVFEYRKRRKSSFAGHLSELDNSQSGNVLFYILIAVSLLAALSFAVSQSGRGSAKQISDERARLLASEIIEYSNTIASAVSQLRLRGCKDTEISFENSIYTFYNYTNPNAPADQSCHVFSPNGGAVHYTNAPKEIENIPGPTPDLQGRYVFLSGAEWVGNGTTCGTSACGELYMMVHYLSDKICLELNKLLGYDTILLDTSSGGGAFNGTYNTISYVIADEAGGADAASRQKACFLRANGTHAYIHVLIPR